MSYGLKVWDANGNVIIDTTSRLPRLVHSLYISAGTVGSVEIPAVADKQVLLISSSVNVTYYDATNIRLYITPSDVSLVGTTLSWQSGQVDSLVFVFVYD